MEDFGLAKTVRWRRAPFSNALGARRPIAQSFPNAVAQFFFCVEARFVSRAQRPLGTRLAIVQALEASVSTMGAVVVKKRLEADSETDFLFRVTGE